MSYEWSFANTIQFVCCIGIEWIKKKWSLICNKLLKSETLPIEICYVPLELTMPSNGAENDRCTSIWSLPHITSKEFIVGIPSGRSSGHISLPANTKLIWNCVRNDAKNGRFLEFGQIVKFICLSILNEPLCDVLVASNDNNLQCYSLCCTIYRTFFP